jgi:rare lipoprotein A
MLLVISSCATKVPVVRRECLPPYTVMGKTYHPLKKIEPGFTQDGIASWYGPGFHGKKTASGETYDMYELTAAHNLLPLKTLVKVTNLANGKEMVVRINDRGPFVNDRMIDLSLAAARGLGVVKPGTAPVRLTVLGPANSVVASLPPVSDTGGAYKGPNPFYSGKGSGLLALIR